MLLEGLAALHGLLTGEISPDSIPLPPTVAPIATDGGKRRQVMLGIVDFLGSSIKESMEVEKTNREPFGFRPHRKAA